MREPGVRWRYSSRLPLCQTTQGSCVRLLTVSLLSLLWLKIRHGDGGYRWFLQEDRILGGKEKKVHHYNIGQCCYGQFKYVTKVLPGSGALVAPEEHSFWFGQPWHADVFPACSLNVPGQSKRIKDRSIFSVFASLDYLTLFTKPIRFSSSG